MKAVLGSIGRSCKFDKNGLAAYCGIPVSKRQHFILACVHAIQRTLRIQLESIFLDLTENYSDSLVTIRNIGLHKRGEYIDSPTSDGLSASR